MLASDSMNENINEQNNIPRLYNWLVYLELEKALNKFGARKGHLSRISANAIDDEQIATVESKIQAYKSLPFYKRIFVYFKSNISELTSLHLFYRAKMILDKLTINAGFNLVEWNKALDELKSLDKEANNNLPLFNFQYIYDSIKSWPFKAKNRNYIFDRVKHAFSNPENWENNTRKVMDLRELRKVKAVNIIAKYLHKQADAYYAEDNRENVTSEQIELYKWRLNGFTNSVASYYKEESWSHNSAARCKTTIEAISNYINDALVKITVLLPIATYYKCMAVFKSDNSKNNQEALEHAGIAIRDQKPIQHDSLSAVTKFQDHVLELNLTLHQKKFSHTDESKEIEVADEQYRRLHV